MSDNAEVIEMTEPKPFLVRAIIEWIWENNIAPFVRFDATHPDAKVPPHLQHKDLILDLGTNAISHYSADNHGISFSANFNQAHHHVWIPMDAIEQVFAPAANNQGMIFMASPKEGTEKPANANNDAPKEKPAKEKASFLKVVK